VRTRASPTSATEPGKRRRSALERKARLVRASSWLGVLATSISAGTGSRQGEGASDGRREISVAPACDEGRGGRRDPKEGRP
jgi:hypothetical protein